MEYSLKLGLLAWAALSRLSQAIDCSIPPVYVDIHKRAVRGTEEFQYGSFMGVGSPAQNQSLWPSLSQNETSVAHVKYCDSSNLSNCQRATRGNFVPPDSTSFRQDASYTSLDSTAPVNQTYFNQSILGRDTFHLYTHFFETDPASEHALRDMSIEVATSGDRSPGIVGVGPGSSLLQSFYDSGQIAARTYSLYIGSGFDRAAGLINGSNVFGGYDSGRFTGAVHSYDMRARSAFPFTVRVADIILNEPNGVTRNISLFDPSSFPQTFRGARPPPFEARITTDQYPLTLPSDITRNFADRLAASPSDNIDGSLRLTRPFNGTMTIVLDDGFAVSIQPDAMFNVSGLTPVSSPPSTFNSAITPDSPTFALGAAYLAQVYLMADHETRRFHLAQAVTHNNIVMPTTFCRGDVPTAYVAPAASPLGAQGMVGAIIAGAVGGPVFICVGIVLFVLWRRRRRRRQAAKAVSTTAASEENAGRRDFVWDGTQNLENINGVRNVQKKEMARFDVEEVSEDGYSPTKPIHRAGNSGKLPFWQRRFWSRT